jgi:hypothetical protein
MIYTTSHDVAGNGKRIGTTVERLEDKVRNSWRAEASIEYKTMAYSHHNYRAPAEAWADKMRAKYLSANAKCDRCNGATRVPDLDDPQSSDDGMMPCPQCA